MANEFGVDISCIQGLDPSLTLVGGTTVLAQGLARRLTTPRGGLFYDPNYGYNVRNLLGATLSATELFAVQSLIEAECEQDERVRDARAVVTLTGEQLSIAVDISSSLAPFRFVLSVSNLTADSLRVEALEQ